jgi:hypothetical protein
MCPIPSIGLAELIFLTGALGLVCCMLTIAIAILAAVVFSRKKARQAEQD